MLKHLRTAALLLLLAGSSAAFGQSLNKDAEAKGMAALKLVDAGKLDEGIALLEEAHRLDPVRSDYSYELGYAYYQKKDYLQALSFVEPLVKLLDAKDRTFEMLGNIYDDSGNSAKAIEAYEAGLRKFPASGRLQLELGIVYMGKKDYDKAIAYFEDGIRVAPAFSSNYYWAAKLFCGSSEEVWGMIYGELFINLERNSQRTAEISKLLYNTYKSEIKFKGNDTVAVSFSQNNVVKMSSNKKMKLPFGTLVYEPVLMMATIGEKGIDLNSLDRIRTKFVENYYRLPASKKMPNVLFDYQQQVLQAGHFEAYNHWLLLGGDEQGFTQWEKANPEKWAAFTKWYETNRIKIATNHLFYRAQYD